MKGLGGWCHIDSSYVAESMGSAGFDWCCIDMQHGLPDRAALVPMVQALELRGCPAAVRVPDASEPSICHALDAGARAVIVPMVSTAASARAAVAACHYPPEGSRSFGPLRAKLGLSTPANSITSGDPSPGVCHVMVEDQDGLANVEEIASTPGLAGVFLGPADLGLSLWGDPRRTVDDAMLSIGTRVARVCADAGITAGVFAGGAEAAAAWARVGFTMIALDSDSSMLLHASRALVRKSRATLAALNEPIS